MMRVIILIIHFVAFFNQEVIAQSVYICTGSYSVAYHSKSDCRGLNNCRSSIISVSSEYAVYTAERRPCCICWRANTGCITDDVSGILNKINPPIPEFRPFVPQNPRFAQVEVGMYLQQKYDARRDWIQERINGLGLLINTLFTSEKIICSKCIFSSIRENQMKPIASYSYSLSAVDFANDYNFYNIVKTYNNLERDVWGSFSFFLQNPN